MGEKKWWQQPYHQEQARRMQERKYRSSKSREERARYDFTMADYEKGVNLAESNLDPAQAGVIKAAFRKLSKEGLFLDSPEMMALDQWAHRAKEESEKETPKERYYKKLLEAQTSKDLFPTSDGKNNPDLGDTYDRYAAALSGYKWESIDKIDPNKVDFGKRNVLHKFHLNVSADDVGAVAQYLKDQGFCHKYLSGGDPEDGCIFTVYIGSKDLADKLAAQLSSDLHGKLCRPATTHEVEYAPNVVGRFAGNRSILFRQYGGGIRGMSMLYKDSPPFWTPEPRKSQYLMRAFERAFKKASEEYGEYFYGSEKIKK